MTYIKDGTICQHPETIALNAFDLRCTTCGSPDGSKRIWNGVLMFPRWMTEDEYDEYGQQQLDELRGK